MRSLSPSNEKRSTTRTLVFIALLAKAAWTLGCTAGSISPSPPSQSPPPTIAVTVNPTNASVLLGNQVTFTATVTNTSDTAVSWSINGVPGGNATLGTITSAGVYTAPVDMPSPATVQVTATSHADATKSAAATLAITSDIALTLTPNPASVELGATQAFQAALTTSAHPDTSIRWSLSGPACASGCGSVDATGTYTAPRILPSPAIATMTAQSVADPSKQISVTVAITSNFSLQLSAPSSMPTGGTATIVATLTPVPGSNPRTALSCHLSPAGCHGTSSGPFSLPPQ